MRTKTTRWLAFNLLLPLGFYNFMLATSLKWIAVAFWWRSSNADRAPVSPPIATVNE